jgi:hypothetical protein
LDCISSPTLSSASANFDLVGGVTLLPFSNFRWLVRHALRGAFCGLLDRRHVLVDRLAQVGGSFIPGFGRSQSSARIPYFHLSVGYVRLVDCRKRLSWKSPEEL